jgi:hypothetical protein
MFIPEEIIEKSIYTLDKKPEMVAENFAKQQPGLMAYLFSDDLSLLTQDEQEYTLYMMMVIWNACETVMGKLEEVSPEEIEAAEEHNWELLESSKAVSFRDRMDVFFDKYPQEDLLAFAEDALNMDDEDNLVTKEGREHIMVAIKSVIDVLCVD